MYITINSCGVSYAVKKYFHQILSDIASRGARSLLLCLRSVILRMY